eukprot:5950721-Prymnesium_polylepis.2
MGAIGAIPITASTMQKGGPQQARRPRGLPPPGKAVKRGRRLNRPGGCALGLGAAAGAPRRLADWSRLIVSHLVELLCEGPHGRCEIGRGENPRGLSCGHDSGGSTNTHDSPGAVNHHGANLRSSSGMGPVSYTHLTLPTICSV